MIYRLSFRDESVLAGGPVVGGRLQQRVGTTIVCEGLRALERLAGEPRVAFLLHGFNVDRDTGSATLRRFAEAVQWLFPQGRPVGGLLATLWPGDHWIGPLGYPFEGNTADDTAHELSRFIRDYVPEGVPISLVAHSLGCRVALETVERLRGSGAFVDQVCLLAGAVDATCLADPQAYQAAVETAQRVTVLHSTADRVLQRAYPAGDWLQSIFFFWKDEPGAALGRRGPRAHRTNAVPENVRELGIGGRGVDHGEYLPGAGGLRNPSKQHSAAVYAAETLAGVDPPSYPGWV